jgi:hypothetical protein
MVMMKRLRQRISAALIIDETVLPQLLSQPLDELRQISFELFDRHSSEGPLSFFRNQTNVIPYIAEVMEKSFYLSKDVTVKELRSKYTENAVEYPRKRMLDYLSSKAPQL